MPTLQLRADCEKCCGLCCVAPAFYGAQGFGFDKPAGRACVNLQPDFRCCIHHELEVRGFPACASFDCYGAGQWVTQELFGGRSWHSSPQLAREMFNAYSRYRPLHELMALMHLALRRASVEDGRQLQQRLHFIEKLCESGEALTVAVQPQQLRSVILEQLRTMRFVPGD